MVSIFAVVAALVAATAIYLRLTAATALPLPSPITATGQAASAVDNAAAVGNATPSRTATRSAISPPPDLQAVGTYHGRGTQTWICQNGAYDTKSIPQAVLTSPQHTITLSSGPTWTADDGSRITAHKVAGITVTGAVGELLLKVDTHHGIGLLTDITYLQRLNPQGGLPPPGPCTDNTRQQVPYTADYTLWAPSEKRP